MKNKTIKEFFLRREREKDKFCFLSFFCLERKGSNAFSS